MPLHHGQNDTVSTQSVHEITAKRRRLLSPTGDKLPSRQPLPVLPDDIIVDILLKLSVRSLLQCRCVCKSWKTLISDPMFAKNHLRNSIADPTMTHQHLVSSFTTHGKNKIVFCPVKPLFENPPTPVKAVSFKMRRKYYIFGSCNGLLCLYDKYLVCIKLWNPSIRLKSKRFPIGFSFNDGFIKYYGFGYDQVNDKYKLLLAAEDDFSKIVTKVYTFGANSWTTIQNFPCTPTRGLGKFVSGTLNWVATRGVSSNQWVILSFDLEKETYREVLLPQQDSDNISNSVLDVLSNCLCVCFESNNSHWAVWLMKEYGVAESWTKLMMIPKANPKFWNPIPEWLPLCISENGVVLVKKLHYYELFLYDLNSGRLDYPRILSKLGLRHHIYHESLVSPLW